MIKRKLSELIRMGAAMVNQRQCKGDYIKRDEMGEISLCADGAAYYALTGELPKSTGEYPSAPYDDNFPFDVLWNAGYFAPRFEDNYIPDTVDMNDNQGMTFEEIAQALEAEGY